MSVWLNFRAEPGYNVRIRGNWGVCVLVGIWDFPIFLRCEKNSSKMQPEKPDQTKPNLVAYFVIRIWDCHAHSAYLPYAWQMRLEGRLEIREEAAIHLSSLHRANLVGGRDREHQGSECHWLHLPGLPFHPRSRGLRRQWGLLNPGEGSILWYKGNLGLNYCCPTISDLWTAV